jgi:crotonyl-CoA carboxylase/reductase
VNVDMVFEHPGEATFPVSTFVVQEGRDGGDLRRHHRVQLHLGRALYVDAPEAAAGQPFRPSQTGRAANKLVIERRIDPCMSEVFPWAEIPQAHHEDAAQRAQARQHGRSELLVPGKSF